MKSLATCRSAAPADVAVLRIIDGNFGFIESQRLRMKGTKKTHRRDDAARRRVFVILNGMRHEEWISLALARAGFSWRQVAAAHVPRRTASHRHAISKCGRSSEVPVPSSGQTPGVETLDLEARSKISGAE